MIVEACLLEVRYKGKADFDDATVACEGGP
jgi:hypothetical protein